MNNLAPPEVLSKRIRSVENGLLTEALARQPDAQGYSLAERMAYYRVPGVSIAVIHNYRLDWAQGYGVRAAGSSEPVDTETLFQAASISKSVTAAAVMRLVDDGVLDLDEDVNSYLASWKVPPNEGWQPRITLRQLLSHTAGTTVDGFMGYASGEILPTLTDILDGTPPANNDPVRIDLLPGTQMRYSGGGTTIVQQALIDVTEKPFPALMRDWVLEPLGMTRSVFAQLPPEPYASNAAHGHFYNGQPVAGGWHNHPELAAAGLWTTPSDLARFVIALQRAHAEKDSAFLPAERVSQMLTPTAEVVGEPGGFVGLGVFLGGEGASAWFGHTGGNVGYRCELVAYVEGGCGAVVMTNGEQGWQLRGEILRAIAREYQWQDYLPERRKFTRVDPAVFAAYVGDYELKSGLRLTIITDNGTLIMQPDGQPAMLLLPWSETRYFAEVIDAEVRFVKNADGSVDDLIFTQGGRETLARRILTISYI